MGETGSGKSFTALSVAGLLPDAADTAGGSVAGQRESARPVRASARAVRGAEIAMVYQDP